MSAPQLVLDLVAKFAEQREHYLSPGYNEAQLRQEFLDPLFAVLGWDMENRQGYADAYKEVIHEDAIKVGGLTKAPDYSFRVGGARKFFVEAKKPSVNLKDTPEPAYQLRRYAWSAKLPLSVLCDFEEFAVYDCRIRPVAGDRASAGRTLYLKYTEYGSRWDEIAGVFSRDAVLKGSFDKYAETGKRKRGTAEVDAAFLEEIEQWRALLAKNFAAKNKKLDQGQLNFAVQRTIDRIIFLRICEDRGIEPYGQLQALQNGTRVYARLLQVFLQADARYNSGLFHFRAERQRTETPDEITPGLSLDDKPLKEVLKSLYYPESPYEFSVLPADILGQVYEQFLGKVIRLTAGHHAKVEEKPEVKKAGGVYYTPTYVVDFIVENTVGKLLEGKTPREADRLRVLDPACGSGSFLIGSYQYLLDWYVREYSHDVPKYRKQLFEGPGGAWRLTSQERRRILLNSMFGVDIDPQAVEVTKLSLLLKVLEGASAETVQQELAISRHKALPDLGGNIKCGNSLIASDVIRQGDLGAALGLGATGSNPFDWGREFAAIIGEGRGFSAIVGNPPYGADFTQEEKEYFKAHYTYEKGKPETYIFFVEMALRLLSPGGMLGMITPNAYLTNYYGEQIRRWLLTHSRVVGIADLEKLRVFKAATVDTAILLLAAEPYTGAAPPATIWRPNAGGGFAVSHHARQSRWLAEPSALIDVQSSEEEGTLIAKLERAGRRFDALAEFSQGVIPYLTKADAAANPYIRHTRLGGGWRPLLESAAQVGRYRLGEPEAFIKYGRWLNRAREPRFFDQPKILFHRLRKKLSRQLVGAIDESGCVNRHSLSNLILRPGYPPDFLWALLALFNSELVNWWFVRKYGLLMEVGGFKVTGIPLPEKFEQKAGELAKMAKALTAKQGELLLAPSTHARVTAERALSTLDSATDRFVASCYDVSDEEYQFVRAALVLTPNGHGD